MMCSDKCISGTPDAPKSETEGGARARASA
nr:MAG TPA: hypothetical protein [Caudoviricetes sp.]